MPQPFEWHQEEFSKAAQQCINASERTYPDFINHQLFTLALNAIKLTEKANADAIAVKLGQIATRVSTSKKTGKVRRQRVYRTGSADTEAARIINARRGKAGEKMIWGAELDRAVRKMISARVRSVGFIKSGWVWALRILGPMIGQYPGKTDAARIGGQPKGTALPAKFAVNSFVEGIIENTSLITMSKSGHHSNPMPVAQAGLAAAFDITRADMLNHLAKKLQPIFDKHSAK